MANLIVKDGAGDTKYVSASGAGSDGDPFVLAQSQVVTDVVPGVAATNLGKAEDAAHSGGDTGVMALAVRNDTPSALAGASGDYIPPTTDSLGHVWVADQHKGVSVTAVVTVTAQEYTAGKALGDISTIAAAVRKNAGHAMLRSLKITDWGNVKKDSQLWLFNAALATSILDTETFALVDADLIKCLGVVPITTEDYISASTTRAIGTVRNINLMVKAGAATTSIYAQLVAGETQTIADTSIDITLDFEYLD